MIRVPHVDEFFVPGLEFVVRRNDIRIFVVMVRRGPDHLLYTGPYEESISCIRIIFNK